MLKRKAYNLLKEWKKNSHGHSAALIEGARRVGKSTVATEFAKNEYEEYLLIDFSLEGEDLRRIFTEDIGNLDTFFRNLFLLKGKELKPHASCIIFDEVQIFPQARQAIKQLVQDGRYDYIETGSLISLHDNVKDILIPSEEHVIKMHPFDFEEFLWAQDDNVTAPSICDAFANLNPFPDAIHRKIMKEFRTYMAVGGMPQAVSAFVEGATFDQIDFAKEAILTLYESDTRKLGSDGKIASRMFKTIPDGLSTHNAHYKFSLVEKGARYVSLIRALEFLDDAMIANLCINVTQPDVLMDLFLDPRNFKLFNADTGLLVTQAISAGDNKKDQLYKALVFDKTSSNMGMIVENAVAQAFIANGHPLRFHEFEFCSPGSKDEKRTKKYEVDFLIVREGHLCPVEVKSSSYKTHKSIDAFFQKYDSKKHEAYLLSPKNIEVIEDITCLPLYMAMCL